jgi:HlyD family secretion protein
VNAVTTRDWTDSARKKQAETGSVEKIRQIVFVMDAKTNTVKTRDVKTGLQDNTYLEITEGIKEGEEVVVAPYGAVARTLGENTKVKAVPKEQLFEEKDK